LNGVVGHHDTYHPYEIAGGRTRDCEDDVCVESVSGVSERRIVHVYHIVVY
jgi:hypothetical protein